MKMISVIILLALMAVLVSALTYQDTSESTYFKKGNLTNTTIITGNGTIVVGAKDGKSSAWNNTFTDINTSRGACWDLDNNAKDVCSGTNNEIVSLQPPTSSIGIINTSYLWDSSGDYITIEDEASIDNIWDGGGTVSFWLNMKDTDSIEGSDNARILFKRTNSTMTYFKGWEFVTEKIDGKLAFIINWDAEARWTADIPSINEWHHIVLTYDSDSTANNPLIYIDGTSTIFTEESAPSGTRVDDSDSDFVLGNIYHPTVNLSRTLDGSLDDIQMWKGRILTPSEIKILYQQQNISGSISAGNLDSGTYISKNHTIPSNTRLSSIDYTCSWCTNFEYRVDGGDWHSCINNCSHLEFNYTDIYGVETKAYLNISSIFYGDNITTTNNLTKLNLPSRIETLYGTHTASNHTDTWLDDDRSYNVTEINNGGDGQSLTVEINFTDFSTFNNITGTMWYEGNPAHNVNLDIYNVTSGTFKTLGTIPDTANWENYSFDVDYYQDFNRSGTVTIRINHTSNGAAGHYLYIDYLALNYTEPSATPAGNWSTHSLAIQNSETDTVNFWLNTTSVCGAYNCNETYINVSVNGTGCTIGTGYNQSQYLGNTTASGTLLYNLSYSCDIDAATYFNFTTCVNSTGNLSVCSSDQIEILSVAGLSPEEHDWLHNVYNCDVTGKLLNGSDCSTIQEVKKVGNGLAIALFMMAIVGGLFIIPYKVRKFSNNIVTDFILRRGCLMVAVFMLMMTTAMISTLASVSGIPLTQELFRVMWFVGKAGWVIMLWLFVGTIFKTTELWKMQAAKIRMGE